jgi:Circularly permutated YpsA SLOG family
MMARPRPVGKAIRIVSGGQTGVDRAALAWAVRRRLPHEGWCPKGRRAEDGTIPSRYRLRETPTARYFQRTAWNVRDSDATVIFSGSPRLLGGSRRTLELCRLLGKPVLRLASDLLTASESAVLLKSFLHRHRVGLLNVAGPRKSQEKRTGRFVQGVLDATFGFT